MDLCHRLATPFLRLLGLGCSCQRLSVENLLCEIVVAPLSSALRFFDAFDRRCSALRVGTDQQHGQFTEGGFLLGYIEV